MDDRCDRDVAETGSKVNNGRYEKQQELELKSGK